ncbi:TIGR00730 family Rossman fold protein [Breoghania sp. L-A4]|uniref:LOG family protein n=1 Tax=Breoghania sp. L-A4 TaxID=2304600 RepID=UPI000E35A72F|nr:TIGR00730 family Rossman fold protein [Breoghania sp. L-A4]AXS39900.1 TIGR00730 family Rossman fold protein [Breoghania sp. L-A4]
MKSICVYCGSNPGRRGAYSAAATALGATIARRGLRLVYGGASIGLMGAVADAALASGGHVIGIMPQALVEKEIAHNGLSEMHVVASMHERKRMMADMSDGFIALPGGVGTMEELFEVWTWAQLGHHDKPCGLLDVSGFYEPLETFLDHQVIEGFVRAEHREILKINSDADALLDAFEAYKAPRVAKWIERDDV